MVVVILKFNQRSIEIVCPLPQFCPLRQTQQLMDPVPSEAHGFVNEVMGGQMGHHELEAGLPNHLSVSLTGLQHQCSIDYMKYTSHKIKYACKKTLKMSICVCVSQRVLKVFSIFSFKTFDLS